MPSIADGINRIEWPPVFNAANSVKRMFSLYFVFLYFFFVIISHFGFEQETLVLATHIPRHCLPILYLLLKRLLLGEVLLFWRFTSKLF